MKQITFSDHTADQVDKAKLLRESEYTAAKAVFEKKLQAKRESISDARRRARTAWQERRILQSFGLWVLAQWRLSFGYPEEPRMRAAGRDERIWSVGGQGESLSATYLAGQLDDSWTLVRGYRNSRGEIDQVLVGPSGIVSIEVKHINGSIRIDGDEWTLHKYDNYGNLVEAERRIADKGGNGRSPSQQLNESTDALLEYLHRTLPGLGAIRIVVLTHEKARIERVHQATVLPVVLGSWSISETVLNARSQLSPADQQIVLSLMKRDHDYQSRRDKRQRPSGSQQELLTP